MAEYERNKAQRPALDKDIKISLVLNKEVVF